MASYLNKYQDDLYENLRLLNLIHPPPSDFKSVCNNRMFAKSNKFAFHQVVYYLLKILYPSNIKKILPSWPMTEIRMELAFRNEVLKAVNDLGSIYPATDIPPMIASQFVSPGGPRFVKFMYKLSQLAIIVSIEANSDLGIENDNFLKKIQVPDCKSCPNLDCKQQHKNNTKILNKISKLIDHECTLMKQEFEESLKMYQDKEKEMMAEEKRLKKELPRLTTKKLTELQRDSNNKSLEEINKEIAELNIKVEEINTICESLNEGCKVMDCLLNKTSRLEYEPSKFIVPQELKHIINSGVSKLNLCDLLTAFKKYVQNKLFEVKEVSTEIGTVQRKFAATLQDFDTICGELDELKNQFSVVLSSLNNYNHQLLEKKCAGNIFKGNMDLSGSELALPLEDTA